MNNIINQNNIKGPINKLFPRSDDIKKNKSISYNMAAQMPKIRVESDNSRQLVKVKNPLSVKGVELLDDDVNSDDSGSTIEAAPIPKQKISEKKNKTPMSFNPEDYQNFINSSKVKNKKSDESEEDSEDESEDQSDDDSDVSGTEISDEESVHGEINKNRQKQDILLKLLSLEKKGVELTKKFSMSSKLSDLKFELDMHTKNAEMDVSVKFQQKILMAAVTGLEMANKKFDPLGAKLDGWSESIMDNLDDYETIFMKLHEKYKERADLPPELQLLVTLAGSAFMFHVTKSIFSSAMPRGMDNFQSSEIMKNISRAMQSGDSQGKEMSGPSINLSGVFGKNDDESSTGTVETSKEITINAKGKKSINL